MRIAEPTGRMNWGLIKTENIDNYLQCKEKKILLMFWEAEYSMSEFLNKYPINQTNSAPGKYHQLKSNQANSNLRIFIGY